MGIVFIDTDDVGSMCCGWDTVLNTSDLVINE